MILPRSYANSSHKTATAGACYLAVASGASFYVVTDSDVHQVKQGLQ
jgi:hypothetical protein